MYIIKSMQNKIRIFTVISIDLIESNRIKMIQTFAK